MKENARPRLIELIERVSCSSPVATAMLIRDLEDEIAELKSTISKNADKLEDILNERRKRRYQAT